MNNKHKISGALALITVSAVSAQVYQKQAINIDSSRVDNDIKETAKSLIKQDKEINKEIFSNLKNLVEYVKQDSKSISVDATALYAYDSDSTAVYDGASAGQLGSYNYRCYTNCYSNCHSACHGSRGWR